MHGRLLVFLLITLALPAVEAAADRDLRCAEGLVSIGDVMSEVTAKCGEPDEVERSEKNQGQAVSRIFDYETERYRKPELVMGPILVERWTYNLGTNRFLRFLDFENGRLIRIATGPKPQSGR